MACKVRCLPKAFGCHFGVILEPSKPRKSCSRLDAVHIFTFSRSSGQTLARIKSRSKNSPKTSQNEYQKLEKLALILDLNFDDVWIPFGLHFGSILGALEHPVTPFSAASPPKNVQDVPKCRPRRFKKHPSRPMEPKCSPKAPPGLKMEPK